MFRWLGLALLGIVVAAAVSIAASRLASQQIGLASQPVSAGDALAPVAEPARRHSHRHRPRHEPSPAPQPAPAPEPNPQPELPLAEPSEPSGESEPGGADD